MTELVAEDDNTVIEEVSGRVGLVSSILVVGQLNSSHSGVYECEATNSLGSVTAQATVTVYGKLSLFLWLCWACAAACVAGLVL